MNIKSICEDNNGQDETNNFWFDVDGQEWAVSETNGVKRLLDCDGCPVDECNDHDGILEQLLPLIKECNNA